MPFNLKKSFCKKFVLYTMIFYTTSMLCMDMEQASLVKYGSLDIFILKDLASLIKSYYTFQDISRVKRLNKATYHYWDIENCNCSLGYLSFACQRLKRCSYHTRTKALAHYAEQKNRVMFQHIYSWQPPLRNYDLKILCDENIATWNLEDKMARYCQSYNGPEKRDKLYCKQIINALLSPSHHPRNVLMMTLKDSGFNMYESPYRKKCAKMSSLNEDRFYYTRRWLFNRTNLRQDIDFFLVIIGGTIQPNMFKSLFKYLQLDALKTLVDRDLIPSEIDRHGKLATYYYQKRMRDENLRRESVHKTGHAFR